MRSLLPNLLPNALGPTGKETDAERYDIEEMPINWGFLGRVGTYRDGSGRIRKPLLYPLSYGTVCITAYWISRSQMG
jgi:hypothetical protein